MNRYVSIAGGVLTAVSFFLPFLSLMGMSLTGFNILGKSGWVLFLLALGTAGIGFLDKRWLFLINLLFGLVFAFLGVKYWADANDAHVPAGLGIYLLQIGGLVTLAGSIWGLVKKRTAAAPSAESM